MLKPSISAFFPCYNDADMIYRLVIDANHILKRLSSRYEIIVINDGSTDNSQQVLEKLARKIKALNIIRHPKNRGYGGALRSGFEAAKNSLIFYTDGDGQYNVNELPLLLSCLTPDIDVVNGIKTERQDNNLRVLVGNAYKSIIRNVFNLPIYDVDCDFRLIRRRCMGRVSLKLSSGAVCVELVNKLHQAGARFREVSVHHYPRLHGQSQFFRLKPLFLTFKDLILLFVSR